ncbi:LssY C-terminal domain-containing protein [Terriglobus aquaticus]|uniref:LssY C-terminal domain-containing protein n=1 Tax=Terriglobus aquaticus TaxID=940139 RepID=UPI0021E0DC83|nr:LssY C-terminal domain-containing protein [Terriglobus aquaticus]
MRPLVASVLASALLPVRVAATQQIRTAAQTGIPSRIQILAPAATPAATAALSHRNTHSKLTIDAAAADWTDTGVPVLAGDALTFEASGSIQLGDHTLSPDGATRGWRDMLRRFPVDTANAGALVGRIGSRAAAVPFTVGAQSTLTATESGNLFLRVNASNELPAVGQLRVQVRVTAAGATPAETPNTLRTPANLLSTLSPATMDALPRRVADRDGEPGDATNFALLGTEQQVRTALANAGWLEVDANAPAALVHGLLNTLQHKPYVEVPMSTLYLFGRPQDLGFARASAITVATERHHLRCWNSGVTVGGVPLWIGAATHDVGLERDQRNGQVTHRIAPEIDQERDFLRDSLQGSGGVAAAAYFTPLNPVHQARTATGGSFTTDGRMLVVQLR